MNWKSIGLEIVIVGMALIFFAHDFMQTSRLTGWTAIGIGFLALFVGRYIMKVEFDAELAVAENERRAEP
jgi:hypothetical protein